MSINRAGGQFWPVCDQCGAALAAETNFYAAVHAKRDAGWRSRKESKGFADICPACYEKTEFNMKMR